MDSTVCACYKPAIRIDEHHHHQHPRPETLELLQRAAPGVMRHGDYVDPQAALEQFKLIAGDMTENAIE